MTGLMIVRAGKFAQVIITIVQGALGTAHGKSKKRLRFNAPVGAFLKIMECISFSETEGFDNPKKKYR
ncbi:MULTISPECIES: hypothetical protein [Paenibacillus]|uniref:Uncharacterized protein n=1 Tax=Paenibacillus pabuli TaxID=1472 RepID=A0A855XYC4_9BACL|nr:MULTISPECIES: hypothetical protein [Paenibacillus]PWW40914.1 hypothetical protein DET56_105187 [Paenibacillus pabuli]PXW12038.1 hypothetical protein DEU73_101910 [Paenibacillus taichungensis]RAI97247.1 hypothetical protein DET54_105210 [Paenibacillus pabuli]